MAINITSILICILILIVQNVFSYNTVRLSDIKTLTFVNGSETTGYKPIAQLDCKDDQALCKKSALLSVTCENSGQYWPIIWKCKADLLDDIMFSSLNVGCERARPQNYADEIIEGSCGLEYSLIRKNIVRLLDIKTLALRKGNPTIGPNPIPQLNCVGDEKLCASHAPDTVNCRNLGYVKSKIAWECKAILPSDYEFDRLDVSCFQVKDEFYHDLVIEGSCGLSYSIRKKDDLGIVGAIFILLVVIMMCALIIICCKKWSEEICLQSTTYTDHRPVVRTNKTVTSVYTVPVRQTYGPPPSYTQTNIVLGGSAYRNNSYSSDSDTHVDTSYSTTSYRNDDYSSPKDTHVDTSYSTTSYRNDDYSSPKDTHVDTGYSTTSYRNYDYSGDDHNTNTGFAGTSFR